MNTTFDIHPDFQSIKGRKLSLEPWAVALMGVVLATVNALHRRKFKAIVSRQTIPSLDGDPIPVLLIRPEQLCSPAPALVYCHGGAFIMKHAPQHLENAVRYAREAHCQVIFVDYRLAPKHPFPAGFDDCYAALRWVLSNADPLGVDTQRVAVGGDSAGGALAAAAAQKAAHEDKIKLCGQLLIYPVTDATGKSASRSAYGNVPPFKDASPAALWEAYLGHPTAAGVPRYAAPIDGELSGLAPAYVEIGEFDMLRDEGQAYARALTARGIDVELNETRGTVHGFDLLVADSNISKAAMASRIGFLRQVFST